MDISVFISDLLFEHDCVIVPGFGGFICNYRPAEIHPVLHIVNPPSKSVSFNINLNSNDGLLVNYIAKTGNIPFTQAQDLVDSWVAASENLLRKNETIILNNIGRVFCDIEGNVQFAPDESVNYLKTSFALKPITAPPVLRGKEVDFTEKFVHETKKHNQPKSNMWKIAAAVILLAGIGALIQMMRTGIEIKPLDLNEAGVFSFFTHFTGNNEAAMKPIHMDAETATKTETAKPAPVVVSHATNKIETGAASTAVPQPVAHGYYIIVGAFSQNKNAEGVKRELLKKYPESAIFYERSGGLTRVGYAAGNDSHSASSQLQAAKSENAAYWLLKK